MDISPKGEIEEAGAERASRRIRTLEEKLAILREVAKPGASVAAVARKHGMNANLLFGWRRLHRQGVNDFPAWAFERYLREVERRGAREDVQ